MHPSSRGVTRGCVSNSQLDEHHKEVLFERTAISSTCPKGHYPAGKSHWIGARSTQRERGRFSKSNNNYLPHH
jgi:hypothetical protein